MWVLFDVLFYLFFVLLISGNLQDLQEEDIEQQQEGEQGWCSLTMLMLYAFSV
jgi:hypothetical protein